MISIVIPVYNSEDTLHVCLNSILKQTYSNFEVICINDSSEDSSKEILDYFTLKDSRIKLINNSIKKGEVYCKNKGLEVANGKYVLFLKSNEWIYSNTLEILISHAKDNNLDLIFFNNDNNANELNINQFDVLNYFDLDKSIIEILNKDWGKFCSKSILKSNDVNEMLDSVERISLINNFSNLYQESKNDKEALSELIMEQHLVQVKNKVGHIEQSIERHQTQTINFINSQRDLNVSLRKSADVFMDNYNQARRYFFNDQESKLKKYFDTNELFRICYFNNFKFLSYSPEENRILIKTDDGIVFGTNNRIFTVKEVLGFNGYSIPQLYDFDKFVVFDMGMNRAYASLWFANFNNCLHVYGFEIDSDTYNKALSNINLNPQLSDKISTFNFGLSNENEEVDLYYVDGCDGVNTMLTEVVKLQPELQDKNKLRTKRVVVKKASEVVSKIINDDKITSKIVLKIDTEGAEYNIISDLIESNVMSKVDVLLGEGHLFEREHFCDKLKELGFKQIELQVNPNTYNFAFVKEDYFKKKKKKK